MSPGRREHPFDLQRFVDAQDQSDTYARALAELRAGRKTSHWMWFVFPQIAGLGHSAMAQRFAISSLAEAQAYLEHPVLGPRMLECTTALLDLPGDDARAVLGGIDATKLRSSMTLFAHAAPQTAAFRAVLERYFSGEPDTETEQRL